MPEKQQEVFKKLKDELKKDAKITVKEDALKALDGENPAGETKAQPETPAKK